MFCWPTDSDLLRPSCTRRISASSMPSSRRSASAHASSEVSRLMVCMRMPKRTSRPCCSASSRIHAIFFATAAGGSPQVR